MKESWHFSQLNSLRNIVSAKKKVPPLLYALPSAPLSFSPSLLQPILQTTKSHYKSLQRAHIYIQSNNTVDSTCLRRSLCCKDLLKGMWKRMPFSTGQPTEYFNRLSTVLSLRLLQGIPLSTRSSSNYKFRSRSSVFEAEGDLWSVHHPLYEPEKFIYEISKHNLKSTKLLRKTQYPPS